MDPATNTIDADALAARLAALRNEQADELLGRRRTRLTFRRWQEAIPQDLDSAGDVAILTDRHSATWLRRAEAFAREIDPGLAGHGFHVADYTTLGITSTAGSGFTYPAGLFEIVQNRLPVGAAPGHVVAVNLPAHAETVAEAVDNADEPALVDAVVMSLCGTVGHELAHLAEFDAAGRRLPGNIDFEVFSLAAARPAGNQTPHHGPNWIRAFAHATHRAERKQPAYFWWRLFRDDVRRYATACPGDITVALDDELAEIDAPLAELLRRPAPAAFAALFHAPAAPAA